jgi:acyl-CoA thioesterase-1
MRIICFGSSITQASGFAEGDRWPTVLQAQLEVACPGKYRVYNRGIGGHTTANLIDRFEADLLPLLPATVVLQIGGNDSHRHEWSAVSRIGLAEFARNLRELRRAVCAHGGHMVFTAYHTMIGHLATEYPPYADATKAVAAELGDPLIDLHAEMTRRGVDVPAFLGEDGVHLSPQGNHIYADIIFQGLCEILAVDGAVSGSVSA